MTSSSNFFSNGIAAGGASVGHNAGSLAGRLSGHFTVVIAVSQCGNFIRNVAVTAGAGVGGVTGTFASRSRYYRLVFVTSSSNFFSNGIAAGGASVGHNAGSLAGRLSGHFTVVIAVSQCSNFICYIGHSTSTYMRRTTSRSASRRRNYCIIAMSNLSTAESTDTIVIVFAMQAGRSRVAQCQRVIAIVNQGKGNLHTPGNEQLRAVVNHRGIVQDNRRRASLVAICQVPTGIVTCFNADIAILAEHNQQFSVNELILTQISRVCAASIISSVNHAKQIIIHRRFSKATDSTNIVLIFVRTRQLAECTNTVNPVMFTGDAANGTNAINPVMIAVNATDSATAAIPFMNTGKSANSANTMIPIMATSNTANSADAIDIGMLANCATLANTIQINVIYHRTAQSTPTGSTMCFMGTGNRIITEQVCIIAIINQCKRNFHIAGNKHFIIRQNGFCVV